MNTPSSDPTSRVSAARTPMTDVIISPSTNTARPWRYLIGYAHQHGYSNHVVERPHPIHTQDDVLDFREDVLRNRRHTQIGIIGMTLMAGPDPLVFRVPVIDGPTTDTHPYRYLINYYGSGGPDRYGFSNFVVDFDVPVKGPAHLNLLGQACAKASRYHPDRTVITSYVLLAGPAL